MNNTNDPDLILERTVGILAIAFGTALGLVSALLGCILNKLMKRLLVNRDCD